MSDSSNVIEIHPDCNGKAEVLIEAIISTIFQEQFGDMTLAETIGCLELVKLRLHE